MNLNDIIGLHNQKTLKAFRAITKNNKISIDLKHLNLFNSSYDENKNVQKAFDVNWQSISKIGSNGIPYCIHPIRVALLLHDIANENDFIMEHMLVGALLHDCIEEGDSLDIEVHQRLQKLFPETSLYSDCAYLLMEPRYIYSPSDNIQYYMGKVSLTHQVLAFGVPELLNVVLADMLDSIVGYLYQKSRYSHILQTMGYVLFLLQNYEYLLSDNLSRFSTEVIETVHIEKQISVETIQSEKNSFEKYYLHTEEIESVATKWKQLFVKGG